MRSKRVHRDKEGEDVFLARLIPPRARGPAGLVTRTPFGTRAIVVFAAFTMRRGRRQGLVKRFPLYPLSYRGLDSSVYRLRPRPPNKRGAETRRRTREGDEVDSAR